MKVRLISYTQPHHLVSDFDKGTGPEQIIAYIARVSSSRSDKTEDYEKLISYLIKNKHWSPFEQVSITVEVETMRAISHQLIRHRSFYFQEFSQRYSDVAEIEEIEIRKQAKNNRQSSEEVFDPVALHTDLKASEMVKAVTEDSHSVYKVLIDLGVAREVARLVLPLATKTKLYMTGTLRSWIHFLDVRDDEHAQKEIRDVAKEVRKILEGLFPTVFSALASISSVVTSET